jgi:hypothetical protein
MDTPFPPAAPAELALAWAVGALAVWRLTHLLHAEQGPWGLAERWRSGAGNGLLGQALGCFYCLSLWVAAPVAAWLPGSPALPPGLLWLALSALAIVIERLTASVEPAAPATQPIAWPVYVEDEPEPIAEPPAHPR